MKIFSILLTLMITCSCCFGQTEETEPNNTFNTADDLLLNDQITGDFAGADTVDYHKVNFNYHGNFQLHVQVTNTGTSTQTFRFNTYNSLTISGQFVGGMDFRQVSLAPGNSYDGSIFVCGLAPDNLYIELKSQGDFEYTIEWFPANVTPQDGSNNNTFGTATTFTFNVEKQGGVRYKFWGNSGFDSVDYFKSILPAANYDSVYLYISAQNNDCSGPPNWIRYFLYKNGSTTPFTSGYVNNNSAVLPYQQVYAQIPLNTMQQGDELVIKYASNAAFSYSFRYKYLDPYFDNEDNCCTINALTLDEGVTMGGNVGEYNTGTETFIDQFDTYKIMLPYDGAVKLWVTAKNNECDQEYYGLSADVLDQYGNMLGATELAFWDGSPACNTLKTDSLKIRSFSAGTYYLRLRTDYNYDLYPGKISYTLRYKLVDSTGNIDIESNNTTATALPINPGEVKKGHVRFYKDAAAFDTRDYYKTTFPADGSLKVYLKTTYRGEDSSPGIQFNSSGFFGQITPNLPLIFFSPDSIYLDTFTICGTAGGEIYFDLYSPNNNPFEYEFWYEITDASSTDNDIEPNNTFAEARITGGSALQKGHIKYVNGSGTDDFDYYKFVYHATDSLKIYLQATNTSCVNNRTVTFNLYNKSQVLMTGKSKTNVAPGQTVTDSIKVKVTITTNPDSLYLRVDANEAFKYQFTTNPRLPSSTFSINGDTAVCVTTQVYKAVRVADEPVVYHWSLPDGGGTLSAVDSIATVTWTTTGNRRIQLYLSNGIGNSQTRQRTVIINGFPPTQTPVAYNFARTLSTNSLPPGTNCQWYRNDTLISGATSVSYYASAAGNYTVKFINDCGGGPVSNTITFNAAAQAQAITFPHTDTLMMSPTLKVILAATSNSGLPVFYQKISGAGTIQNDTLYIAGNGATGTTIVKAMQPGDDVYSPATDKYDTIVVIKGNQVITFDSIPNQILDGNTITLTATSSAGTGITYSIVAGTTLASVNNNNNKVTKKGAGTVTVRASQGGNANYNPATPVDRTFCIGIRTLTPIVGDDNPCLNTYTYTTQKIPGANFVWTLSSGGILTTHNDTAFVQWQTPGAYTLTVKANSPCDTTWTEIREFPIITSNNTPGVVTNMLPADNSLDQQLPLTLSWIPGTNTVNYDLFVWDSASVQPGVPFASNITASSYVLPKNSFVHNTTYKWKVVAKNPCSQTAGPVQHFRIIPLPDLVVSNVQAPATATSGQTITISWTVTNIGPGATLLNSSWSDGVYFALDTVPYVSFQNSIDWNASSWNSLTANGRPLLLGKKERPVALGVGQSYTNSLNFTLPVQYSFPLYVYVITNNQHPNWPIAQASVDNDTVRKQNPILVSLAPTPDLRVDSVAAPSVTFSGSTVNFTYKVKNYGVVTPTGGKWVDSFFISQNSLFDRQQCIPLKLPKSNDSYYPNAFNAYVNDTSQLNANATYTKSVQLVIPNFIFGTWFIYVKTNASVQTNNFIYEGALSENNLNNAQIQVYLTPTPKLTVNTLSVPVSSASITQPIGVNWNISNEGFTDNFEKNKGHYLYRVIGHCPCNVSGPPGSVCQGPPKYFDSLAQGSSYWLDKVYLSKDSNGLNIANARLLSEVKHGTEFSALQYPDDMTGLCGYTGAYNVSHALYPGSNFAKSLGFNVPSDLAPGTYYIYVYTNPTKTVFEYPGTPQIKRSTAITISRPDVTVSPIAVPPTTVGAQPVTVDYSILNNGPGSVFNHSRTDRLYISNFPAFDVSAQLVKTQTYTESIPVGTSVPHAFTYNMPAATTGNKYFFVLTNYDSSFWETDYVNNLSAAALTSVSAAVPADLVVTAVTPADSVFTIFTSVLGYSVTNNGTGKTTGSWIDSLFISCSPVFNPATSYFIARKIKSDSIAAGGNYQDTVHLHMPFSYVINSCFPQQMYTNVYFYIKTNANNQTYEGSSINNNITGSGSWVLVNPLVDQIVTTVTGPDTTIVGRPYPANWTIKNIGYNPNGIQYYYSWVDAVYFSADSILDVNDALADDYLKYIQLGRNEEKADHKSPLTPTLLTGDYYLVVKTNSRNGIATEKIINNNTNLIRNTNGAAKKIHVIRPLLPDLKDSIISAPSSVAIGQPVTVIYKVTNAGDGVTYPNSWRNTLRLSADFFANPNDGDRGLFTRTKSGTLLPGEFYYDTVTATIPSSTIPGNYVLISYADASTDMAEILETNNLGLSLLEVYIPPLTDLTVESIMKPDTVYLGYTIDTAKWVVRNSSANTARGYTKDALYLSTNPDWDSTAVLLGIKNKNINMEPLTADTVSMAPLVNAVTEGNYYLIAAADVQSNIPEETEDNNHGVSSTPIYVKVKELKLHVNELNTLQKTNRYYKLLIPDSLLGSTIRISLKTNDSLTLRNEMFVGAGYVPTAAHHDYQFEIPNYGNQQIIITDVSSPVYYINISCVSPNPVVQNITVKAEVLPFTILNVNSSSGGNIGNVTVKISGSLFNTDMTAKIIKGTDTITASAIYYTNSTIVYATFNLRNAPLGVYNVRLTKADSSVATLANGFTVVVANNGGLITGSGPNTAPGDGNEPGCDPGAPSGLNSQLVVELVVPSRAIVRRPVVIQIHYSNPTNYDIPAQTKILYSEEELKMAFTKEGVATGTTALYIEMTEAGGPPGIIRAGGSGTITIHTVAPRYVPADPKILFKLR
jgi:hypothetical protein